MGTKYITKAKNIYKNCRYCISRKWDFNAPHLTSKRIDYIK